MVKFSASARPAKSSTAVSCRDDTIVRNEVFYASQAQNGSGKIRSRNTKSIITAWG
jgi:hypothetical protein